MKAEAGFRYFCLKTPGKKRFLQILTYKFHGRKFVFRDIYISLQKWIFGHLQLQHTTMVISDHFRFLSFFTRA